MNKIVAAITTALGLYLITPLSFAHHPITENKPSNTSNQALDAFQQQGQYQNTRSNANSSSGSSAALQGHQAANNSTATNVNSLDYSRSFTVTPVTAHVPAIITPAAGISRMVDQSCGPRMRVVSYEVEGTANTTFSSRKQYLGEDQEVMPDDKPYYKYEVQPGVFHLMGHRMIETSAVITVSANHAFSIGGNSNNGGGASLGTGGGGAMQRLVTTIRLQECVVAIIDERPKAVAPKPVRKPKHVRKPTPVCPVCIQTPSAASANKGAQ